MNDPNIRAPGLLERYREEMLVRRYAKRTITSYVSWLRRYLRFHHLRHPREMGQDEINAFLTHLAVSEKLSASSQNQALGALLFLFSNLQGTPALVAQILYGSGLRLMEALYLRIKDVDFEKNSIVVRDGKGDKERITRLPERLMASLQSHLSSV
jgi:site-specific recombinase XerD